MRGTKGLLRLLHPNTICWYGVRPTLNNTTLPTTTRFTSSSRSPVLGEVDRESVSSQADRIQQQIFSDEQLMANYVHTSSPCIDYGDVMRKFTHRADCFVGRERESVRRVVWEEQDCTNTFPTNPHTANLDVRSYLDNGICGRGEGC